jgi:cell shape-determining protein MreC
MSQKEISELKVQLKTCMANEEAVRLLKEKLEQKSHKCEQLKSENESLKRSLEVKVWIYTYLLYLYK